MPANNKRLPSTEKELEKVIDKLLSKKAADRRIRQNMEDSLRDLHLFDDTVEQKEPNPKSKK